MDQSHHYSCSHLCDCRIRYLCGKKGTCIYAAKTRAYACWAIWIAADTAATAFIALAAVPVFPDFTIPQWIPVIGGTFVPSIAADLNIGILFVLGMMAAGLYGPLLAGMAQANKWGLIGAARTAVQFLSYEVVTGLSILAPIMIVGSLSFVDFNAAQAGGIANWLVWKQPVAFVLFLIAGFAETNRTPFDLLEHEAEVVSGYATE